MNGQQRKWTDRQSIKAGRKLISRGWNQFENALPEALERGLQVPRSLTRMWKNNIYVVQEYPKTTTWGTVTLLMVRRNDAEPIRSWSDMQRIKNELLGEHRLAVEVYPSEANVIDQANMYHLWVLPENFQLPFGLHI